MARKQTEREAYEERAAEVREQIAEGKTIDEILADRQAAISLALLRKALEED
jgi:hypothetical protein